VSTGIYVFLAAAHGRFCRLRTVVVVVVEVRVDVVEVEVRAVVREVRTTGGSSEILYLVFA
jgi:hypothetical protein